MHATVRGQGGNPSDRAGGEGRGDEMREPCGQRAQAPAPRLAPARMQAPAPALVRGENGHAGGRNAEQGVAASAQKPVARTHLIPG